MAIYLHVKNDRYNLERAKRGQKRPEIGQKRPEKGPRNKNRFLQD